MRKKIKTIAGAGLLILVLAFAVPSDKYFEVAKSLDIFATLFKEVNALYVDEIDPKKLVDTGIDGMLQNLDPYTDYIPEDRRESFSILTTGQYAGIGSLIGHVNKKTVVTHPYPGFPAYLGGLKVGDEFISVDGKNVQGKSTSEVSTLLKGKKQTEVTLVMKRWGQKENLTFKLKREQIKINNISYSGVLGSDVGYIQLTEFTPGAGREVEEAVRKLKTEGAKKIVLDLRNNPGGSLYEAVNIVNVFIPKGQHVVSMKGRAQDWNKSYTTLNDPVDVNIPVVVITGPTSASASEIVAGALQDYDRAVLLGQRTFGKGLVQTTRQLSYGAQLKVTTAKYYIPSGRCIQELDYSHRQPDGKVNKIADSLKREFKTSSGRKVFDGGGLLPDVPIQEKTFSSFASELAASGFIFDFATMFCNEHPAPVSMKSFSISEANYVVFTNWMKNKPFTYRTNLEKQTEELIVAAQTEQYYEEWKAPLNQLKTKVQPSLSADLIRYQEEIKYLLAQQIGFHYFLWAGERESTIAMDVELKEAIRLLSDPPAYQKLLAPAR